MAAAQTKGHEEDVTYRDAGKKKKEEKKEKRKLRAADGCCTDEGTRRR